MSSTDDNTIRADVDPRHYLRFLLIGIVAFGFALYCLYDGFIAYPAQRVRALRYQELEKQSVDEDWQQRQLQEEWKQIAAENDWPVIPPGEPKTDGDIVTQFVMAAMTGGISLLFLTIWFRSRGRWIEGDGAGLRSSWGQSFTYDQITSLDKKLWRNKGIAKVSYQDGNRTRRFVVDDFKFQRKPTDAILLQLESHIDPALITGGPPEPSPEEHGEETADEASDAAAEKTTPAD